MCAVEYRYRTGTAVLRWALIPAHTVPQFRSIIVLKLARMQRRAELWFGPASNARLFAEHRRCQQSAHPYKVRRRPSPCNSSDGKGRSKALRRGLLHVGR